MPHLQRFSLNWHSSPLEESLIIMIAWFWFGWQDLLLCLFAFNLVDYESCFFIIHFFLLHILLYEVKLLCSLIIDQRILLTLPNYIVQVALRICGKFLEDNLLILLMLCKTAS